MSVSKIYKQQLTKGIQNRKPQVLIELESARKGSSFAYQLLNNRKIIPTAQHKCVTELIQEVNLIGMMFIQSLTGVQWM